ncbi:unnamed protein product, partial [Choristocarpus tenellus]
MAALPSAALAFAGVHSPACRPAIFRVAAGRVGLETRAIVAARGSAGRRYVWGGSSSFGSSNFGRWGVVPGVRPLTTASDPTVVTGDVGATIADSPLSTKGEGGDKGKKAKGKGGG